jgi:hypothetical protein
MLTNRIVIASAVVPALLLATAVGVLAQTASAPTSKRVVLLRIVEQSAAKVAPNAKMMTTAKPVAKHKFASRSRIRRYARLAGRYHPMQVRTSEEVRPAGDTLAIPPTRLQPPAPPTAEQLGELFVGGHALQVASSAEVNEIDLVANSSLLQLNGAPPNSVAEDNPPTREIVATKSDFANVAVTQRWGADVGSTSWILQVLAALGGAVTAGSVAWFLIGRRPEDAARQGWRVWTQRLLVPPAPPARQASESPRNAGSFI